MPVVRPEDDRSWSATEKCHTDGANELQRRRVTPLPFTQENRPMTTTFRIFVRTAEGSEFQAFTWCRDEASGIARAWREGREFGHNVVAVWAEAVQ